MSKYATVAIDSLSELARLYFSKTMNKTAQDMDKIRDLSSYPGATERLNITIRSLRDLRDRGGAEVVLLAHEDVESFYPKNPMTDKNAMPYAIKGWPDLPGKRTPEEVMRVCDNCFHMRVLNGKPTWIALSEPVGPGAGNWLVKDRFNAPSINHGYLPPSYEELKKLVLAQKLQWDVPWIWLVYGPPGVGKTRSLLSFPRPLYLFDLDKGSSSLKPLPPDITVDQSYNSEHGPDYELFKRKLQELIYQ